MMSKRERRQLRQIERNEYATDPRWATLMSSWQPSRRGRYRRLAVVALLVIAAALVVLSVMAGAVVLVLAAGVVTIMAAVLHVVSRQTGPRLAR